MQKAMAKIPRSLDQKEINFFAIWENEIPFKDEMNYGDKKLFWHKLNFIHFMRNTIVHLPENPKYKISQLDVLDAYLEKFIGLETFIFELCIEIDKSLCIVGKNDK